MAVATKKRRQICYKDKKYIWYVKADEDFYDKAVLHILSENKKLILSYPLNSERAYIVSEGTYFQNKKMDGCWHRYALPFDKVDVVTPRFVSEIIEWAEYGEIAEEIEFDFQSGVWL